MASPPRNLVWCIPFLLLALAALQANSALLCPNCGNLSVPYPLSTSSSCGHPLFPITCTAQNSLQVNALSGNYTVLSLSPATRTLIVAPGDFLGNSCISRDSASAGGFSLNQTGQFFVTENNTVLLFNASAMLLYSPLQCGNSSPCAQALMMFGQESCKRSLCCSFETAGASIFRYSFPVKGQETGYTSVVNWINGSSARTWSYGIQLGWNAPTEPPCNNQSDCGGNSTCSASSNGAGNVCKCNDGYLWDAFSGTCPKAPFCLRRRRSLECNKFEYAIGLTLGFMGLITLCVITAIVYRKRRAAYQAHAKLVRERSMILAVNSGGKSARLFSNREMKRATNNFSRDRVLGCGGFGEVYKGILDDNSVVAIKSAKLGNVKGTEQVLNEVRILSQVNHRNLVRLLGCCVESELPLLVYEYVPNGNLFDHLHGLKGSLLQWKTRLQIALQSAEGLAYLHSAAYPPIYHRDVKSSNILLDKGLNAKVADFGLSRLAEPDLTHVSTCAQGTLGYLDPEYYRNYQLTDKSDVYSFGVVLLELVTSQRAIDFSRPPDDVNLAVLVQTRAEQGMLEDVIYPELRQNASKVEMESMRSVLLIALDCLQENRLDRPPMKEVAEQLQYIITIEAAGGSTDLSTQNGGVHVHVHV